jgi:F-type H+-transporting ATPase subunit b
MANETAQAASPADATAAHPAAAPAAGDLHTSTGAVEHKEAFPPFDPATFSTQLIWLAFSFLVLYVVLSRMALPRIGTILEDRKARIDGDLAAADTSRQKTDAAIAAYEAALAEARQKSHALAEETRTRIKADITAKRSAVEADLSQKVAAAEASIQASKLEALGHVGEIAADTVQALVSQLAGAVSADEARDAVAQAAKE